MSSVKVILFSVLGLTLVACGGNTRQSTLGDLKYKAKEEKEIEVAKLSHEEVREEYKELLDLFEDKQLKEQIERRIADVYMMEGVQEQTTGKNRKSYYLEAIKEYKKILEKYPNSPDNAEVLYQLAKAYDMEGQTDEALKMLSRLTTVHPWYPHIAEAWFRKADIHFNLQEYKKAEQAYLAVTRLANEKLWTNARYMLAWCYYKQFQYDKSLQTFAIVLQEYLTGVEDLDALGKAERPVADDTLHSMSLALDKLGGADHIPSLDGLANQTYVWMVYKDLGDYYLEKELYGESVKSYKAFVNVYPQDKRAPVLHNMVIAALEKGSFPEQALEEKARFVSAYGLYSNYRSKTAFNQQEIDSSLRAYLNVLAAHFHSEGQAYSREVEELTEKIALHEDKDTSVIRNKAKGERTKAIVAYNQAANYYREYIASFASDDKIDEKRYRLAEVLFAADRYEEALTEYELVAYKPQGKSAEEHRPDAGYAAIISYQKLIAALGKKSAAKKWQAEAVESMLRFAETFHTDERSPAVLTNAAEYMFSLDQYERAISITDALLASNTELDRSLKKTAYGILAHSWFKLENYPKAEASYLNQRNLVSKKSEEFSKISERLATTIYKNSEVLVNEGSIEASIAELLKIKSLSPDSKRRVPAQYDAAVLLMQLQDWPAAIRELQELNSQFKDHELAAEFPRKLASAYENNEDWSLAADAYIFLTENDSDEVVVREALFLAANMYENARHYEKAITTYKKYAHAYEEPFETRMEARYKLALNYGHLKDDGKQQYWLRRIIEGHRTAGAKQNARSTWLAAWANITYGDYYDRQFRSRKLRQPIVESIAKRKDSLEKASKYYQAAADSQLLEYVTESGYKIANLYQALAADLRKAPAPSGLSDADRQLYKSIIEEQALPMDQLAVELYTANVQRAWDGEFDKWIEQSFAQLAVLYPERYAKTEILVSYGDEIR